MCAPSNASGGPDVEARAPRRVLIVDDDRDTCESLGALLSIQGYEADWRTTADGLSEHAATFGPDVVLLDLRMPKTDGYHALESMRAHPALVSTPVIAVTGMAREEDRRRALAAGFADHIAKPFDFETLREMIERVCEPR